MPSGTAHAGKSVDAKRGAGPRKAGVERCPTKQHPAKILPPQLRGGSGSSYYENNDFENVWVQEFLSHEKARNEEIARVDLLNFTELPGSTVHPHSNHDLTHRATGNGKQMPDHERQRLEELSKTLRKTTATKKGKKEGNVGQKKKFTPPSAYVKANTKISRVLQHNKPKWKRENMQASQLDDFYRLVTRETTAAIALQSQWRRVMATKFANRVALEKRQATKVQSFARGYFARKLLRRLKDEKQRAEAMRAQFVRLHVARCRRRKRIRLEQDAAVTCQSVVRMFFAKQVTQLKRLQRSWELNQQRWRAISIRLAWANLRINFHARQIQCMIRRRLARKRVSLMFVVHTGAAISIQSIWRRFVAWKRRSDMVYQLNVDQRCNKIRIIASEHIYWKQQVEELTKPAKLRRKTNLEEQQTNLKKQQREKYEQIDGLESHYRDQLQVQQQITPRAIAGGWEEQVQINLRDTRELITRAKLDLFFDVQMKLKSVTAELDEIRRSEDDARTSMEHWGTWQQVEQDRLWDFQRQHDRDVEEREKQHSIINEQMRWAVKFTVPSGKPDKRRPLLYRPTGVDDDRGSSRRVQQLIDVTKLKADEFQSANHLANTFRPFDKM
ncbi:hypothetical protein ACHAWF_005154, partial [Thalassiosira exigua]